MMRHPPNSTLFPSPPLFRPRGTQPVRCVGNAMDSESRHVFFQPVEVLRQERWVVHAPNYECGYVNFCTPTRRAVARRRNCETIGSVIVQTAGDRTGLRPSLDIFGFEIGRASCRERV